MPRKARVKYHGAVYHIMCRSISEILLFRENEDMDYYLSLLKRFKDKYLCSVYGYCLMNNHLHIQLDTKGFDISSFMHSLNTAYVRYYNKKYCRHGHVFQERFQSKILDTAEYNLAVSAYIHNNPKDIEGYSNKEEEYQYSSYGIYLGTRKDDFGLIDKSFIIALMNCTSMSSFNKTYFHFVSHQKGTDIIKDKADIFNNTIESEYLSGRKLIARNLSPEKVVSFISERSIKFANAGLAKKGNRKLIEYRSFNAYALRVLCGLKYKDICATLHNVTISGCSSLCDKGWRLLTEERRKYKQIFDELVQMAV